MERLSGLEGCVDGNIKADGNQVKRMCMDDSPFIEIHLSSDVAEGVFLTEVWLVLWKRQSKCRLSHFPCVSIQPSG